MYALLLLLYASTSCPVLNTATARGAIGEEQLKLIRSETSGGYTCQFTGIQTDLTIKISTLASPTDFSHFAEAQCRGGRELAPLKAIGNEAITCSMGDKGRLVGKVIGRVRNKAFVIRLTSTDQMTSAKSLQSKAAAVAEQVAGNLF